MKAFLLSFISTNFYGAMRRAPVGEHKRIRRIRSARRRIPDRLG
jgi:hypothetical protein